MSSELRSLWESAGGKLPDDWSIVPLESLLRDNKSIAVGVMYPGEHTPGGTPLIKVGDIKGGNVSARPDYCISAETNQEYRRTQLVGDELLITLVGNPGECVVVKPEMAGWNPARAIASIKLKDVGLRTYLKSVLESSPGKHLIDAVLNTTVQKTLNLKDIRRLPIPMPDRKSVEAISQMSEAITNRIALLRETNATLEAVAQALFKSWFVDFDPVRAKMEGRVPEGMDEATAALFPDALEESELGWVPKGWRVLPIGDAVEAVGGATPDTKNPAFWEPAVHCWTTPKDLSGIAAPVLLDTERKLSAQGLAKIGSGLLPVGTLLLSSRAPIGYLALAQTPLAINQGYIAMPPGGLLPPLYLYFWCRENMETIKGRANGSTFMEISKKAFRPIPALVPPPEVLQHFLDVANTLFARLVENETQAQALATLRDTLLPRLISGQLRLPEAQAATEAALGGALQT